MGPLLTFHQIKLRCFYVFHFFSKSYLIWLALKIIANTSSLKFGKSFGDMALEKAKYKMEQTQNVNKGAVIRSLIGSLGTCPCGRFVWLSQQLRNQKKTKIPVK